MEYCFVNLVAPGDKVIVCRNGVFGGRMLENVERCGGVRSIVDDEWGQPVDPHKVEDAFRKNPGVKVLAFVHAELQRARSRTRSSSRRSRTSTTPS
jgi:alanine-glyoxylate transaminase/serine-glyoxylate transaminase/serine-pyruvate transaminase